MQDHAVHAVDGLNARFSSRVRAVREEASRHRTLRDSLRSQAEERRVEVVSLVQKAERLAKVGELFRTLMDRLVEKQKGIVEGLVTEGLQAIFHDQGLAFEAEVAQRANRVEMDLFIRRGSDAMSVRDHPMEGFGGGPSSAISLFLRVFAMKRLGRWPLILLDETLPAVSAEYVDATGRFLKKLCATMGVDVLLITHKPEFLDHADIAYQGHEESIEGGAATRLVLRQIRGKVR